ncbi:MAG TPA: metalloprotease TldD, partial [Rhodospirillales bacterium]|nr:metalloprotease TldD [Rhodospirillales bacterium]
MTDIAKTEDLFFNRAGLDKSRVERIIGESLENADDGELFLEYQQSENFVFDDGQLKNANFDTSQGFGLRAVAGEMSGYAHASELSEEALLRAGDTIKAVQVGYDGTMAQGPAQTNQSLYMEDNPLNQTPFETKVRLLSGMDAYARGLDERIRQFSASLSGSWQAVQIIRADGSRAADIRPLVRLNVSCIVGDGDRLEAGSYGTGGRETYESYINSDTWQMAVEEALRQAIVNLGSVSAPAGEMPVVLGPGWPAILLHEAIGHGLEGDFNRKKTSAFSELVGERVAAPGVTVVDDGTIENRRGSLTVDDEGTPTQRTVLIEDGVLTGYMQDRMNARLMGKHATGNGRRESYAHLPMPRMTNTIMEDGNYDPEEIIKSVKKGLYAVNFGG